MGPQAGTISYQSGISGQTQYPSHTGYYQAVPSAQGQNCEGYVQAQYADGSIGPACLIPNAAQPRAQAPGLFRTFANAFGGNNGRR